ncbi:MAG: CDP-diacylglycerol--glycerol-3-phosphate 3-phosphatidyltransferase [Clostridia bacterium]|nr:CDP-diacylglycerol--glycerol-3-phosphate 3-phosphatidyltransferase [Clostridia bacterium]
MNLPNKLTVLRICLVPVFMIIMMAPIPFLKDDLVAAGLIGAALFVVTSLTDMLDGKIARKYNLITDFGKFMDPLADKFMVFGALLSIVYRYEAIRPVFIWAAAIVMFRELAVTSIRLVVSGKEGLVVAASWLGKVKTVLQIVCIVTVLVEPALAKVIPFCKWNVLSYVTMAAMLVMTLWSGIDYLKSYWKFIDPTK